MSDTRERGEPFDDYQSGISRAIKVDKQGLPERWGIDGDPGTEESMEEEEMNPEGEIETTPRQGS